MKLLKINIIVTIIYYIQTFIWIFLRENNQISREKESIFVFLLLIYLTLVSVVFNEKIYSFKRVTCILDYIVRLLSMFCFYNKQIRDWLESYVNIYIVLIAFILVNAYVEYLLYKSRYIYDTYRMDKSVIRNKIKKPKNEIEYSFVYKNLKLLMGLIIFSYMLPGWYVISSQFFYIKIYFIILIIAISVTFFLLYILKRKEYITNLYEKEYVYRTFAIEFKWLTIGLLYALGYLGCMYFNLVAKNSIHLGVILPQILCTSPTYQNIREIARFQTEV